MKLITFLLVLVLSVCCSFGASFLDNDLRDPEHPGNCVYKGTIIPYGQAAVIPEDCVKVFCKTDGFASIFDLRRMMREESKKCLPEKV